jgi:hypothetical protein
MKFILYTIVSFLLLFSFSSKAQNAFSIKGSVADTASASKLQNASVLILRAKDSIMVKFTRVNQEGNFAISNLPGGKYLLLVTYPEYADYSDSFSLDAANPSKNFGKINMLLKAKLLQDIVIKATPTAIKIKGDTTVFNASAYVVQPNAKVEDLIKQFPGIQVDKDGKVTANGQTVSKFLVDGEEFFGDDPTLVTKNIRADMVKEVQMYDKKSDQAAFTGVDDGQKTRTMNVVLREDKKNGYFGSIYGGIGNNDFYTGQLGFNKFKGKEKIAVYGIAANTGKTSLSSQDAQRFGDGGNVTVMDGGGIMISGGGNDLSWDGRGIPNGLSTGAHYENKWDKDKHALNTNYKIGMLDVDGNQQNITQNNLKDRVNLSTSNQQFNRSASRQKLDATYLLTIDTSANLKIIVDGTLRNSKSKTENISITNTDIGYLGVEKLSNYQKNNNDQETEQRVMNASAFYTKKLKKKGRTLSVLFNTTIDNATREEYQVTRTETYDPATETLKSAIDINQHKPGSSSTAMLNSNFTYTEPLSKYVSLVTNYGLNVNNGKSDMRAYNRSSGGQFDQLVPELTNNFTLHQLAHQAGAIFNYAKGKTTFNFGTRATDIQYKQINELTDREYERHFINWMPQARYQYRIGTNTALSLNYNGSTRQPTISQLQPVLNNSDPLNLTIGNPDLKPAFSNSFNAYYSSYKALSGTQVYFSGSYQFTTNQMVSNTTTIDGKTTFQTVNITGRTPYSYNLNAEYTRKLLGISTTLALSMNKNVNYNMVNGEFNTTTTASYSPYLTLSKYEAKKYDIYIYGGPTYSVNKTSLQQNTNNNSYGFSGSGSATLYLPGNFQISSRVNYRYTGKTPSLAAVSYTIVNGTIDKTFLKDNSLKLTATLNDIFNQNIGFSRNPNGAMITQSSWNTIRRFFMIGVTWDFSKMGAAPKQ